MLTDLLGLGTRGQTVVGIDVGSSSVKCVQLTRGKSVIQLDRAEIYPKSTVSENGLGEVIKTYFAKNPGSKKRLRISLSGSSVVVRRITLPIMTHAELKGAIRFEAESHIPFSIDECVLDFQILNQVPNQPFMNVLLVAAKKDFVEERLVVLNELEARPESIDADFFSIMNAFELLNEEQIKESYGLLNIGHKASLFVIVHEGQPFVLREIPHGALRVAQSLAELKEMTPEEAETMIKTKPEAEKELLKQAADKGFEPMAEELKSSIDYFEGETGQKLNWIGMSGGGSHCHGAADYLAHALGRKVAVWDCTKRLKPSKEVSVEFFIKHAPEFVVAFGAALGGIGKAK